MAPPSFSCKTETIMNLEKGQEEANDISDNRLAIEDVTGGTLDEYFNCTICLSVVEDP